MDSHRLLRGFLRVFVFGLILPAIVLAPAAGAQEGCWNERLPARIWPEILFVPGADLKDYQQTMAQSRHEVRQMFEQEYVWLLKEVYRAAGGEQSAIAADVLSAVMAFDEMHDRHKDAASRGLPETLGTSFLDAFDQLYRSHKIPSDKRRAVFASLSLVERLKRAREDLRSKDSEQMKTLKILREISDRVDLIAYGTVTAIGNRHRLNVTLENVRSGSSCHFESEGPVVDVTSLLAEAVFEDFQAVRYPPAQNPHPHLTWIAPSAAEQETSAENAWLFCEGQGEGVRLPYARELVRAAQLGSTNASYVDGGIPKLTPGYWAVADKLRHNGQHYYYQPRPGRVDNHPLGPIRIGAGLGALKVRYWCVSGEPETAIRRTEAYYSLYRKIAADDPASPALGAIEYLLNAERELSARKRYSDSFGSEAEAIALIERSGYDLDTWIIHGDVALSRSRSLLSRAR